MRGTIVAVAAVTVLVDAQAPAPAPTLLTIPQRDRIRSRTTPPSASVSGDGRFVAFASYEQLTPSDTDTLADIYVLDRATGSVELQTATVEGAPLSADCTQPRISGDGRYVVFETVVTADEASRAVADVVLRDRIMSTSRRLSRGVAGEPSNGWSGSAVISGDGGVVAFESSATNLVAGVDANGILPDVYLVDTRTDVTRRISVDDHDVQSGAGSSGGPSVSADGRYVVFTSTADLDLARPAGRSRTAAAGGAFPQVYVHDARLTRTKHLGSSRQAPNGGSVNAVISGDGRYVAFVSYATNLAPSDRNRSVDVFLYEMNTGSITLVSRSTSGRTANGASGNPSISADGRFVAFQSEASDMVCARACESAAEDINLLPDVFLFDRMTHTVRGISGGSDGPWMEESGAPALDAIGDVIAFTSRHPIDARDLRNDFDLFVRVSTEGDSHIHRDHPRHPLTTPIH